jgi:hypothetical protein
MLPKPEIGQHVVLSDYSGDLIITAVSNDGGKVNLVSEADPEYKLNDVSCLDLLPAEGESAD